MLLMLGGCGGGGGSGGSGSSPPPPNPLFVINASTRCNDSNSGGSRNDPLCNVSRAAQIALSGYTIIVGPGTYRETVTTARQNQQVPQGIAFYADTKGAVTGGRSGDVIIEPPTGSAGFNISNTGMDDNGNPPIIDGFTIRNATDAGIVIKGGGPNGGSFIVQSCVVTGTNGDGIRIQGADDALVANNLVYSNTGNGILISQGSKRATMLNNTITQNDGRGITVGNATLAAPTSTIRNNIIQTNGGDASIKIFPNGDQDYSGGFNLVLPDSYIPTNIENSHDIHKDAAFVDPVGGVFYVVGVSPAINAGTSVDNISTKDPTVVYDPDPAVSGDEIPCFEEPLIPRNNQSVCEVSLKDYLNDRTATGANSCDRGAPDLGFHTLPAEACTGSGS
jgi:parallel beta-helix repeat protein